MYITFKEVSYLGGDPEKLLTEIEHLDEDLDKIIKQNRMSKIIHDPTLVQIDDDYETYDEGDKSFHKILISKAKKLHKQVRNRVFGLDEENDPAPKPKNQPTAGQGYLDSPADQKIAEEIENNQPEDLSPIYPLQFTFLHKPKESCKSKDLILIIISDMYNFEKRQAIRDTFCSKHYLPTTFANKFQCVFVVAITGLDSGDDSSTHPLKNIEEEAKEHQDILIPDVPEKNEFYHTILSTISSIYHIAFDCETTYTTHQNVIMIEDSTFVNLPKFLIYLTEMRAKTSTLLVGVIKPKGEEVNRKESSESKFGSNFEDGVKMVQNGKISKHQLERSYKVDQKIYSSDKWPQYYDTIDGAGILMSNDIIQLISKIYHKVPIFPTQNFGKYLSVVLDFYKKSGSTIAHLDLNHISGSGTNDIMTSNPNFGKYRYSKAEFDLKNSKAKITLQGLGFEELAGTLTHNEFCEYISEDYLVPVSTVDDFKILFLGFERCSFS